MVAGSIPICTNIVRRAVLGRAPCGHPYATLALGPRLRGDDVVRGDDVMRGDDVKGGDDVR